ncbi:MAG: UDP-2,3-diacylglucosamine diphosphatase [Rhodoferax sp.]
MELQAPSRWRCIDIISDLHLQEADSQTFVAWRHYLEHTAADAVFILGDLFEVWVGDDVLAQPAGFEQRCVEVLRSVARRLDLHIMHGNRDFLMGPALMQACSATLLDDPTVLAFAGQRWLLTHGDALCLDDTDYQQFRAVVRSAPWQRDFLAKPLPERLALARGMRAQSEALKQSDTVYADVDSAAANTLLQASAADHMIHGHTHRPGKHPLVGGRERLVLSDWDLHAHPPRAEVLRLRSGATGHASTLERLPPAMAGGAPC